MPQRKQEKFAVRCQYGPYISDLEKKNKCDDASLNPQSHPTISLPYLNGP